jgi:hypothetical protein
MKKTVIYLAALCIIIILGNSCKNTTKNTVSEAATVTSSITDGLLPFGKDMITEVVVKPDTLGDPWEVEKVKGFNGGEMFVTLFKNIYNKKLTVYDCITGKTLAPADVRKMESEIGSDMYRIGKIQFLEDWYFNPATNVISKKIKSVSFGYEVIRGEGLPPAYKALFQLKL